MFAGCEQPYAFDVEGGDREVVVHSIFSPGFPLAAELTYSRSIFDTQDFKKVLDAEVVMEDMTAGTLHDLHYHDRGIYLSDSIMPIAGHYYRLSVRLPSGELITSSSYVPDDVQVVINAVEPVEEDGEKVLRIDFDIINQDDSNNYYVWDIVAPEDNDTPDDINDQYNAWLSGGNVNANRNRYRQHWKVLYEDVDPTSNVVRSSIIATDSVAIANASQGAGSGNDDPLVADSLNSQSVVAPILLRVQAVSKPLYDYYHALESYNRNGGLNTSYATPVELYTNVEGGYGVFAGYNENILTIN